MQGELFSSPLLASTSPLDLPLTPNQLLAWQQRLHNHQAPLFRCETDSFGQADLFGIIDSTTTIDPLALTPLPLSFWRWTHSPHQGVAIYLVMDRPPHLEQPLLLYVGETQAADRRWKGEHDCKSYLTSYSEALQQCGVCHRLSIRFYNDVPSNTRARRALEQQLIRLWWPPFNKETCHRWATPFVANLINN
ncbi:GIY-YIG nuclease family protein [Synechococcus sp. M16CYN]|uniref:GIY-YIG nuclease family protein n=1 Tax=Synechococcus sp. M16CYN TaxID=3103139 RepID=UPI0032539E4E